MAENNAAFVGAIPQNYDRYLGPILFHGHADDIASRWRSVRDCACWRSRAEPASSPDACSTASAARARWWRPT